MTSHSARVSSLCWNSYIVSRFVVVASLLQNPSVIFASSPQRYISELKQLDAAGTVWHYR